MLPRENGFFIFQLFARSVFKFPPTWEGKSDSEPREEPVCSIVGALRGEAPAPFHRILISLFKQESKGCRCSALDLIVSSVGSTPRGEHAADLVSRRESGCRWNTRSNAFSFARRWRIFPGFDETFIRLNISRRNITFNDLSSPLALSRSSYYKRISRKKENKIVSRWFLFPEYDDTFTRLNSVSSHYFHVYNFYIWRWIIVCLISEIHFRESCHGKPLSGTKLFPTVYCFVHYVIKWRM